MTRHELQRAARAPERDVLATVCSATAALFRAGWGRGPRKCRAFWAGANVLVVLLDDGLTDAEKTLRAGGYDAEVTSSRRAFQALAEPHLRRIVEDATGRSVSTVLSATQLDPPISAELFLFDGGAFERPGAGDDDEVAESFMRAARVQRQAGESIAQAQAVRAQSEQAQRVNAARRADADEARAERRAGGPDDPGS